MRAILYGLAPPANPFADCLSLVLRVSGLAVKFERNSVTKAVTSLTVEGIGYNPFVLKKLQG